VKRPEVVDRIRLFGGGYGDTAAAEPVGRNYEDGLGPRQGGPRLGQRGSEIVALDGVYGVAVTDEEYRHHGKKMAE
jgi:hypothetical protein